MAVNPASPVLFPDCFPCNLGTLKFPHGKASITWVINIPGFISETLRQIHQKLHAMKSATFFGCLLMASLLIALSGSIPALAQKTTVTGEQQTTYTYKIITLPDKTYGYDVFANGKLLVHQATIPAMPGNSGFATKKDATKVAELVIRKLKDGIMPPTITVEELRQLKVIS